MPFNPPLTETERLLIDAYSTILDKPFKETYEDKWEDEPFDRAIDQFKTRAQEIGFADPFDFLGRFKIQSYEAIRAELKKGPALCFRPGWKSPSLGSKVDPLVVVSKCIHVSGPKFRGEERVVVLDFWACWCDPCLEAGPEVSELAEEFAGRVAFIGINNETMFSPTKPANMELLNKYLDENKDAFRYLIVTDNDEGWTKEVVYKPTGYKAIPCAIVLVDGVVTYVGSIIGTFKADLEKILESLSSSGSPTSSSQSSREE